MQIAKASYLNTLKSAYSTKAVLARAMLAGLAVAVLSVFALSGSASAYGGGYGPPGGPIPIGPGGGFPTIVTARTISPGGGIVYGTAYGASIWVDVPAGSIPGGAQIAIVSEAPCGVDIGRGSWLVADFGVVARNPATGALIRGPFTRALSVVVTDRAFAYEDSVVTLMTPGRAVWLAGASVGPGKATLSLRSLPSFFGVASSAWSSRRSCSGGPQPRPGH